MSEAEQNADYERESPEALARHLDCLYGRGGVYGGDGTPCRCDHAYKGLGRDHGLNMGKGWVRMTTHPDCYHHGDKAERERKKRQHAHSTRSDDA